MASNRQVNEQCPDEVLADRFTRVGMPSGIAYFYAQSYLDLFTEGLVIYVRCVRKSDEMTFHLGACRRKS